MDNDRKKELSNQVENIVTESTQETPTPDTYPTKPKKIVYSDDDEEYLDNYYKTKGTLPLPPLEPQEIILECDCPITEDEAFNGNYTSEITLQSKINSDGNRIDDETTEEKALEFIKEHTD